MPIQITISAETAAEAAQLVHDLAGTIAGMKHSDIPANTEVSTVDKLSRSSRSSNKVDTAKETPPAQAETAASQETQAESVGDTGVVVTIEQLRAKAAEVAQQGKQPQVKALLEKFGAKAVSAVPEERRGEFLKGLEALA